MPVLGDYGDVAEVNPMDLNTLGTVSNEEDDVGTVLGT